MQGEGKQFFAASCVEESLSTVHVNSENYLHYSHQQREQWSISPMFRPDRVRFKAKCIEPGPTQ
jgi:hypothetical protein